MGAGAQGWEIKLMIIKDSFWTSEIANFFPNLCVFRYDECEKCMGLGITVDVWLSYIDPPRKLSLWDAKSASLIVTSRWARNVPDGWIFQRINLTHVHCGGATDGLWSFYVYRVKNSTPVPTPAKLPGRDLTCILDSKIQGLPCHPPNDTYVTRP
jgi:hypothetical protein